MSLAEQDQYNSDRILSRVNELPTLPAIVYELSRIINDPMSSTKDVEKIMAKDQSLTLRVLKLVNSAYYSIPGGVSNLGRAIAFLGFDTVNQLVLSSSIIDTLKVESSDFQIGDLWMHSMGVGVASECIAKRVHYPVPADIFTAGLIHDLGKVVLLSLEPVIFLELVKLCKEREISFIEAEQELGIVSHTKIGNVLAEQWKLPRVLMEGIRHHHTLEAEKRMNLTSESQLVVDMICLGNLLVHALKFGNGGHHKVLNAPKDLFLRLALDPISDFKSLLQEIKGSLERAEDFIRIMNGK